MNDMPGNHHRLCHDRERRPDGSGWRTVLLIAIWTLIAALMSRLLTPG